MAKIAHTVYFTLSDRSQQAIEHLLSQCRQYLDSHEGLESFAVGTKERDLNREVNGDFDVSLHLLFADRAAHDAYQVSQRHESFIDANLPTLENVIVYDSEIQG